MHAEERARSAETRKSRAPAHQPRAASPAPPADLSALQGTIGNAAMVQMLRRTGHPWAQDQDQDQDRHGPGHRQTGQAAPAVQRSAVHDVLRTSGRPLDAVTRTDMEARLGADFSDVRIHDDSAARASAAEVGARAYTSGHHVVIGDGGADDHTLAHELTHVIQQRSGPVAGVDNGDGLKVSDPSDRFEREAEANAKRALSTTAPVQRDVPDGGAPAPAGPGPVNRSPAIQRAVYLGDLARRVYKDESDPVSEYAYLCHQSVSGREYPLFVRYGVLAGFQAAVDGSTSKNPVEFVNLLGDVYAYDSSRDGGRLFPITDALGRGAAGVARTAYRNGATTYNMGGGSRLPDPNGVLFSMGLTREKSFEALGIPEQQRSKYSNITFIQFSNPQKYQKFAAVMENETPNHYRYDLPEGSLFYASTAQQVRGLDHRIRIAGTGYSDQQFDAIDDNSSEAARLLSIFNSLPAPVWDSGWIPGTQISARDRGSGQDSAMGNVNAIGAAALANRIHGTNFTMEQRWEWLHIRGAQLGGSTAGGNLVAGIYATNSAMIPFENQVLALAQESPQTFWVRFTATPYPGLENRPFARRIHLHVKGVGHPVIGTSEGELGSFDPLTGNTVDKLAQMFINRQVDRNEFY
ncbi:eCIS core domain-containing protein [Streptomyces sp. PTD5-9]|uniref:eCIS core domain-containing protein n=1 Tax=Streptomyces sp. PTD5-9 TaxID=3120150 RepID=UPI00300A4BCC